MELNKIEKVERESKRLLETIKDLKDKRKENPNAVIVLHKVHYRGGKHTAAIRRSSMDLTRALAELRKY